MLGSRGAELLTDNPAFENDNKSELPSQLRTGEVTVVDLASSPADSFNPGWRFYASFISLCIITLAVALDATSLSVALPVKYPISSINYPLNLSYFLYFWVHWPVCGGVQTNLILELDHL